MSGSNRDIDERERTLFRQAVADARPLPASERHTERPRAPARVRRNSAGAQPASTVAPRWHDPTPEAIQATPDQLHYRSAGVPAAELKKLRRQRGASMPCLDLHGLDIPRARRQLAQLLDQASAQSERQLLIIHGKGLSSGERGPVLKAHVACWLQQSPRVLAYVSARPDDGGSGALYVLLRRPRR